MKRSYPILALLLLTGSTLYSQSKLPVQRLEQPIIFDGIPNEAGWKSVSPLKMLMLTPEYGQEPKEPTTFRIAYDDNFLYFSGVNQDANPDKWQIQLKRDDWKYNCDWSGIIIDSYNDEENTVVFATSPSGGRTDVAFSNDANDLSTDMNLSWNTFWEVKSGINSAGWTFEMRIPFSSLRFQEIDGEVTMGISAWRYMSNNFDDYVYPLMDQKHGFWGVFKASQTQKMTFTGIQAKNPVYIAPYIIGGVEQSNLLNDAETAYEKQNKFTGNVGGDVKYRLSDKLTMDLTVNTDFAQVEADDQMVNLTRFSLFFPEKRLFFQERRSNFEFNFDQSNRLFYTRRIGLDDGMPVDIYGGARLVGRAGPLDIGALSMQTAPDENLPSENFSVVRLRRRVFNANSYVGGIVTNRMDFKGNYNTAYGVDGIFRLFGDDYLKLMWAQTFADSTSADGLLTDPTRIYLNWERRTLKGFGYNVSFSRAGPDYQPGIGFERRQDFTQYKASAFYGWMPERKFLYTHKFQLDAFQYNRNLDGSRETAELWAGWNFETSSGGEAQIKLKVINDDLMHQFNLSDEAYVPAANYTFTNLESTFSTPKGKKAILNGSLLMGQFYDGWINSISISPKGTILKRAQIGITYQYNQAVFSQRQIVFNNHILRFNGTVVFNTKLSFSAFVQYNTAIDAVLANARLRFNPKEGTDLYIVYNEGYNTERYLYNPTLPLSDQRTLLIKYTHTFIL